MNDSPAQSSNKEEPSGLKKQCPLCSSSDVSFRHLSLEKEFLYGWALQCLDSNCLGLCLIPGEKHDARARHKAEIAFALSLPPKKKQWEDYEWN